MKQLFLFLVVLLATKLISATPLTNEDTRQVAQNYWHNTLHQRGTLQFVSWQYSTIHLYALPTGGFVMVAADDAVRPILAYSTHNSIRPDDLPVQLTELLDEYTKMIDFARHQQVEPVESDRMLWNKLMTGASLKTGEDVQPLLETLWDQDPYYNHYCPDHTVAGCAAICQAQVMRYWRWPAIGEGSHKYKHNKWGTLAADFGHQHYEWDLMPDQLKGTTPLKEIEATATLIYHVGVSINMDYNSAYYGGSGAIGLAGIPGVASVDNSLKDYFRYKKNMYVIEKSDYNDSSWAQALADELQLGHPIVYCGQSDAGGHGFVCDGFEQREDNPYFHFNFGWSGVGDGYYTVDDISPNVSPTGTIGAVYTFDKFNSALIGCVPDYRILVSDTTFSFPADASEDSVLFSINPINNGVWTVSSNQSWLVLTDTSFDKSGYVHLVAEANNTGGERTAMVTFTQGEESITVKVMQTSYTQTELCPLTVLMTAHQGQGWRGGAHLSFESPQGFVYATATLSDNSQGEATAMVGPHDVVARWIAGGNTDRDIDYSIINQHGDTLLTVEYAYRNAHDLFIEWPCSGVSVDEVGGQSIRFSPNPVTDLFTVQGLQPGDEVKLIGMTGCEYYQSVAVAPSLSISTEPLPSGVYMLLVSGNPVGKVVKY